MAVVENYIVIFHHQGLSKRDKLHRRLARIFNTSLDNVDVFSVMPKTNRLGEFLDVRMAAHGSPYYPPERINYMVLRHLDEVRIR